jgi:phage baseplate assembly protein W
MSFDVAIVNGDLSIDDLGQLALVRDINKVAQDVVRVITTTKGSDPLNTSYGISSLTRAIGAMQATGTLAATLEAEITTSLNNLIAEQDRLALIQTLTTAERIQQIDSVVVTLEPADPRQLNVAISMTLESLEPITLSTSLQLQ